jgi:tryptophan synthase beta subunit
MAQMQTLGPVCTHRMTAWQKCLADERFYVVFMVKPAHGPKPYLTVVDDYGTLVKVWERNQDLI